MISNFLSPVSYLDILSFHWQYPGIAPFSPTDALQAGASQFETNAGKLKRKYWWKNCKMMIILAIIILVILIIIIGKYSMNIHFTGR